MSEFGIFNPEGLVDSGFVTQGEAETEQRTRPEYSDCHVAKVCEDHPEHENATCEDCLLETDDGATR